MICDFETRVRKMAECSICLDIFTCPKLLWCGHTFCRQCAYDLCKKNTSTIPCPLCRRGTKLRGGQGLANSHLGQEAVELYHYIRQKNVDNVLRSSNVQNDDMHVKFRDERHRRLSSNVNNGDVKVNGHILPPNTPVFRNVVNLGEQLSSSSDDVPCQPFLTVTINEIDSPCLTSSSSSSSFDDNNNNNDDEKRASTNVSVSWPDNVTTTVANHLDSSNVNSIPINVDDVNLLIFDEIADVKSQSSLSSHQSIIDTETNQSSSSSLSTGDCDDQRVLITSHNVEPFQQSTYTCFECNETFPNANGWFCIDCRFNVICRCCCMISHCSHNVELLPPDCCSNRREIVSMWLAKLDNNIVLSFANRIELNYRQTQLRLSRSSLNNEIELINDNDQLKLDNDLNELKIRFDAFKRRFDVLRNNGNLLDHIILQNNNDICHEISHLSIELRRLTSDQRRILQMIQTAASVVTGYQHHSVND